MITSMWKIVAGWDIFNLRTWEYPDERFWRDIEQHYHMPAYSTYVLWQPCLWHSTKCEHKQSRSYSKCDIWQTFWYPKKKRMGKINSQFVAFMWDRKRLASICSRALTEDPRDRNTWFLMHKLLLLRLLRWRRSIKKKIPTDEQAWFLPQEIERWPEMRFFIYFKLFLYITLSKIFIRSIKLSIFVLKLKLSIVEVSMDRRELFPYAPNGPNDTAFWFIFLHWKSCVPCL